ncbi:ATP-dependent RecD-like DNA helicase [Acetanaerobacterium elongatum]|uniref:ATP-dependent RecD2 DNA helicase n=1 Tax=Acetanaerobacterium elongatum TaxID=258515 RepID=A0A1H0AUM8_9FIRM|nr:ATP-dependent RecD-like DNA helicase [Acetanaerobacterium elongatum]SDN37190.1 exodeoxyribonuclease V alpha subunit [Acetanaerobacterium elongatum]
MQQEEFTVLEGTVETIVYHNDDSGFTVIEVNCGGELITAVGELGSLGEGEEVRLMGQYATHASYGSQFRAATCEVKLPATAGAILKYLSAGAIKGIGPKTARKIVEAFGDKTLEIIEKQPELLSEVNGISQSKAKQIENDFKKVFGIRTVMAYLKRFNITPYYCIRAWKKFGPMTIDVVNENPFALCSDDIGLAFKATDEISRALSLPTDAPARILAGIQYELSAANRNGHTCMLYAKLVERAQQLLDVSTDEIENVLYEQNQAQTIVTEQIGDAEYVYLPQYYDAERFIACRLSLIIKSIPDTMKSYDEDISRLEAEKGIHYERLQKKAIAMALSNGITVLTGGPGTGKTTTIMGIIELYKRMGKKVLLAAPTGRAAKRMSELSGYEAKTIHRLLEVEYSKGDQPSFRRNSRNPLNCDVIIIDEFSMVDTLLFESLLSAVRLSCRIVLVGDSDQLPSVGAGNILHDLIQSDCVPTVTLTEIFRQAAQSLIVTNAHDIINGEVPQIEVKDNDFFFIKRDLDQIAQTVVSLCRDRLPKAYAYSPLWDIQVLCPSRQGELGTAALNSKLQASINPKQADRPEVKSGPNLFRLGDKVMQIRNNYDIIWTRDDGENGAGVFNGDIGIIESIDRPAQLLTIRFDDRVADYTFDQLIELELAYAITVHKSQGSEYEAVIIPLAKPMQNLYYRNLLYTAVTRAKKLLIILGAPETLSYMVGNNRKTYRYTNLQQFITDEVLG